MLEIAADQGDVLGEGPVWDHRSEVLWWVDIKGATLHRLDPSTEQVDSWSFSEPVGSLALRVPATGNGQGLLLAVGTRLLGFDPATGSAEPLTRCADEPPGNRLNDGKTDPAGRFWVGSMDDDEQQPVGTLYRFDPDHTLHRILGGLDIPNSLAWSTDGSTMYFTETRDRTVVAFDAHPDGSLSNRRVFVQVPGPGSPDGAAVDAEGGVWVCEWGGGRVVRYRSDGTPDRVIEVPVSNPTCCCFGGPRFDRLYITTARKGLDSAELADQPQAGAVFVIEPGVTGLPAAPFPG